MLRPSSRDHILDVAARIASEDGASQLTIDAVAKGAAISKGGVMYHFKTKDDLLSALVERVTQAALASMQAREATYGNRPAPMLDAYIDEGLNDDPQQRLLFSGLLGAVANRPALAAPAAQAYSAFYRKLESLGDMAPNALVIALALDGLLFLNLLNLVHLDGPNRERLRAALKVLAEAPLPGLTPARARRSGAKPTPTPKPKPKPTPKPTPKPKPKPKPKPGAKAASSRSSKALAGRPVKAV